MLSAGVIWLAVRFGATQFARYLPSPVGRGLSLGFGLTILWLQLRTVGGWFVDGAGKPSFNLTTLASLAVLAVLIQLAWSWRRRRPSQPYLLALLPVAVACVALLEMATSIPFDWIATPPIHSAADLLPPWLPGVFAAEVLQVDRWGAAWSAFTVLVAQALFVAFTFMVDSAGNATNVEHLTGEAYDLNGDLRASALSMALVPWFGLIPGSLVFSATRPLYDTGVRSGRVIQLANVVVIAGLALLFALAWAGQGRVPLLFVVAALVVIGLNLLDPNLFERPGSLPGERSMWWQTWLIGLVFLFTSGVFAMLAGFVVAVAQLVRGAEGTAVRSIYTLRQIRSRRWRSDEEEIVLRRAAGRAVVVVLQGTASFAVARRIREEISRVVQPQQVDVVLVDAQRVVHWDLTALDSFRRMADEFQRSQVELALSHPSPEARKAFEETVVLFANTDKALEWAENEVLRRQGLGAALAGKAMERPAELPLLARLGDEARRSLIAVSRTSAVASGQPVFNTGDADASLMAVLAGSVSIEVPSGAGDSLRVATFGPGMVFGEMAFLDGSVRSGRAAAVSASLLFVLPREAYLLWAQDHPHDAQLLMNALAAQLSHRLRFTTAQLIAVNP
jgi:MFS superfamily sulfate permease-like transporter